MQKPSFDGLAKNSTSSMNVYFCPSSTTKDSNYSDAISFGVSHSKQARTIRSGLSSSVSVGMSSLIYVFLKPLLVRCIVNRQPDG